MKSAGKNQRSKPQTQSIEWQLCENELEWQVAQTQPPEDLASGMQMYPWGARKGLLLRMVPLVLVLFVLVFLGGWWLWDRAQNGLDEIESELEVAVSAELWSANPQRAPVAGAYKKSALPDAMNLQGDAGEIVTQLEIRDLGRDWAVIEVHIQPTAAGPTYRQTRVYHDTDQGWVRAEVTAERWGRTRQLESTYFVFHYRSLDEEAVTQAATQLDALYAALYSTFFSELPVGEKLAIRVDPERLAGELPPRVEAQVGMGDALEDNLVVASPAATLTPVALAAGDLLLQSLVLALFDHLAEQAPAPHNHSSQWFAMHTGLRLWFIWEHELPLSRWREPLVKWVFGDSEQAGSQGAFAAPEFAHDLCNHHKPWMRSPLDLSVPILCWQQPRSEERLVAWRFHQPVEEVSLASLIYMPMQADDISTRKHLSPSDPGVAAVGLATLYEYVASTYGVDRIPLLLAAITQHERAETLIPAVFGLSLTDFDRGWQTFLAERYNIIQSLPGNPKS